MTNISNASTSAVFFPKNFFLAWCKGFLAVGFAIVVVNLATILTFVLNRQLRRRSLYCLINLAIADMAFGLLQMTESFVVIGEYTGFITDYIYPRGITYIVFDITMCLSLFSLIPVSLERAYATFSPFRHRQTRLRSYLIVFGIAWVSSISMVIAHNFILRHELNVYSIFYIFILFLLCLVTICVSYIAIFFRVKIQAQRVQTNQQRSGGSQRREQRLAMTVFIVAALSLASWLPFIIGRLTEEITSIQVSYTGRFICLLIQHCNSLINPIVFVIRMGDFRKALLRMIFKCSRDQQQIRPSGNFGNRRQR